MPWSPAQALGQVATILQLVSPGGARQSWDELQPWVTTLLSRALPRWMPFLQARGQCHVLVLATSKRCKRPAISPCVVCRQLTCLEHSFVNHSGEPICFVCVDAQVSQRRGGAPPPAGGDSGPTLEQQLSAARKVLRVKKTATLKEIHESYRRLAKKRHPDRGGSDEAFCELQSAYELLKKHHT